MKQVLVGLGVALGVWLALSAGSGRAADQPSPSRVERLTVGGFVDGCNQNGAQCLDDAREASQQLIALNTLALMDDRSAKINYCEPDQVDDRTRRDVLLGYFDKHPELRSGPLLDGAEKAFSAAWAGECESGDRKLAARKANLEQTTVSAYLALCDKDVAACEGETVDLVNAVGDEVVAALIDNKPDPPFCPPKLTDAAWRQAMVGYFRGHPELASSFLLSAGEKAITAMWPRNGREC